MLKHVTMIFMSLVLAACAGEPTTPQDSKAHFDWFEYTGQDQRFELPLKDGEFRNPIIAGFHPDPTIERVGDDYYMTHSTFSFYPGLPVFHSQDLINWTQIGNAIDRPAMLDFAGLHMGYQGIYAPAITYRDGTFYIISTCVGCGGNFVLTAEDPKGPWSDPIWLKELQGIDPSLFFDEDGRTYIVHHRNPEPQKAPSHTAVWIMEVDPGTFAPISEDVMLVDGGDPATWRTEYLEAPHLYKVDGRYVMISSGGGTEFYHSQLAYRADSPFGPYEPYAKNPILTQLDQPNERAFPTTSTGHADMVKDPDGNWWAVFLGTRDYEFPKGDALQGKFHTGRETFLHAVEWKDGWPIILKNAPLNAVESGPTGARYNPNQSTTGNFTTREDFDNALPPQWLSMRQDGSTWSEIKNGKLIITPKSGLGNQATSSAFTGRRVAHKNAVITTKVTFSPGNPNQEAGLMALQNDTHFLAFGLGENADGQTVLRIRERAGDQDPNEGRVLKEDIIIPTEILVLRVSLKAARITFAYSENGKDFTDVLKGHSSLVLTTQKAGGFTSAVIGPYGLITE